VFLWTPKFLYYTHKGGSLVSTLNYANTIHTSPPYCFRSSQFAVSSEHVISMEHRHRTSFPAISLTCLRVISTVLAFSSGCLFQLYLGLSSLRCPWKVSPDMYIAETFSEFANNGHCAFHTVHYNIMSKEKKPNNAQIYILLLHCSYMFRSQLTIFRVFVVTEYIN
jgi:hypothetical protein